MNYIRYWQASGESIKTSERVKTRLAQITQEGHFRGGTVPYGYRLVKKGRYNKKNCELYDIEKDDYSAKIVEFIFDKYIYAGMGVQRIANLLNENKVATKTGKPGHPSTILNIIKNRLLLRHSPGGNAGVVTTNFHLYFSNPKNDRECMKALELVSRSIEGNVDSKSETGDNMDKGKCSLKIE